MNFKDMLNSQILPPKKAMQQNEINEQIRVAAEKTAEYIRTRILSAAKYWTGTQANFAYSAIVSFQRIDRWVKNDDFVYGIADDIVSIKTSGLIFQKETETHIVTINDNGKLFHDILQSTLNDSGIVVSPWLICGIRYSSDYIDDSSNSGITKVPVYFKNESSWVLYFESDKHGKVNFHIGTQLQYDGPIEFSDVYITERFGEKHDRSSWNYGGNLGFSPFTRASWQRNDYMSLCLSISYSNK